jgi:hypothetical protein
MSDSVPSVPRFSLGRPWLDALTLGGLLGFLNFLTARQDPGWLALNPSPWVLLPLMAGARYGFRWGFLSGAAVSLIVLVLLMGFQKEAIAAHSLFFLALPTIGLLAGEAHALFATRLAERDDAVETLLTQRDHLGADLEVAEDARFELQERLALLNADTASLDQQLRGLFEPGAGPIFPHLLRLLRDTAGVTDAALYQINGSNLTLSALLGDSSALPASLSLPDTEIANLAVTRGTLVTCRQVWSSVPAQNSPWLAALPWPAHSGPSHSLLLIHRMDFASINWRTFSRIQMICRWVAQFMELRGLTGTSEPTAGPLLVPGEILRRATNEAAAAHREHSLPSTTVTFRLAPGATAEHADRLGALIAPQLRTTDLATQHPDGHIEVLLTFDSARDAERFTTRVQSLAARDPLLNGHLLGETPAAPTPGLAAA